MTGTEEGWRGFCSSHLSFSHCSFDVWPLDLSLLPVVLCRSGPVDFHLHSQGYPFIHVLVYLAFVHSGHPLLLTSCQNYSTSPLTFGPFIHPFIKLTTHPRVHPLVHPDNSHPPSQPSFNYSIIIHLCINPYIYSPIHCTYSFIYLSIHPSIFHPSIHHLMHTLYIYLQYSFTHRLVTHPSIFGSI